MDCSPVDQAGQEPGMGIVSQTMNDWPTAADVATHTHETTVCTASGSTGQFSLSGSVRDFREATKMRRTEEVGFCGVVCCRVLGMIVIIVVVGGWKDR
jgi:hypothetical protein